MLPGFYLFGIYVSSYTITAIIGAVIAVLFAVTEYKKRRGERFPMLITLLLSSIGAAVGGSLLYAVTNMGYWYLLSEADSFKAFLAAAVRILKLERLGDGWRERIENADFTADLSAELSQE